MLKADADGNPITGEENPAYYYVVDDGKVHLVACLLTDINNPDSEFATISTIDGKPVTKIGSAVYHFTKITAKSIKISDGIDALGNYSFYSGLCAKNCADINLNQVIRAGKGAFQYCNMAAVVGNSLKEIGENTFSDNYNLHSAILPKLSSSSLETTNNTPFVVFLRCSSLRFSEVGYSKKIEYDNSESMKASYIRLMHMEDALGEVVLSQVNTITNKPIDDNLFIKVRNPEGSEELYSFVFNNGFVNGGSDFSDVYYSDYYNKAVSIEGLGNVNVRLPGYVYYEESDGNLTLFAVSPDIDVFGYASDDKKNYVTPNVIYSIGDDEYTFKPEGKAVFRVTKIGNHAYGAVRGLANIDSFTVGSNITVLGYGALSGSAYVNGASTITVLQEIGVLNLAGVTVTGPYAFKQSSFASLSAPNLKNVGEGSFYDSIALQSAYLPSYEEAGAYVFVNCKELVEITLGKDTKSLATSMFSNTDKLKSITILREKSLSAEPILSVAGSLVSSSQTNQITLKVYAGILNEYKSKYGSSFGGINISGEKLVTFENVSTIGGVSYYWNIISGTNTAYIDYIEGAGSPTEFEIPSSFEKGNTTYTVSWVTSSAIKALGNKLTVLTLPNDMQYLAFSASDLPNSLQALVIKETNAKFATVGGILYSHDMKTLFVYPQSKSDSVVTLNENVTEIYAEAFYSVNNIVTLNIKNAVTINDRAFAEAVSIKGIVFSSETASIFAGRDIFAGVSNIPEINVPDGKVNDYKANVYVDTSIISKMS